MASSSVSRLSTEFIREYVPVGFALDSTDRTYLGLSRAEVHREKDHRVEPADRIRQCGPLRDHWQHLQFPLAHGLRAEDVRGSMTHNMKRSK